jgi:hypothetical protein
MRRCSMTNIKARAVELINTMSDEKVVYVVNILQGIDGLTKEAGTATGVNSNIPVVHERKSDYEIFQESLEFLKQGRNEIIPDEFPRVHW